MVLQFTKRVQSLIVVEAACPLGTKHALSGTCMYDCRRIRATGHGSLALAPG
jgi:hypothetical protein